MSIDFSKEVDYIARLARIALEKEEKKLMADQLSSILDIAQQIQDLDTTDVEPTTHVNFRLGIMREDCIKPSLILNRVLQNSARRKNACFSVPSIIASEPSEQ